MGDEPPLLAGAPRTPDRRDVSLRWLSGTFLTGIAFSVLMGVSLVAAFDGREEFALPGQAFAAVDMAPGSRAEKGNRPVAPRLPAAAAAPADRRIMEVSTLVHDGDRDVVRRRPFARLKMSLASARPTDATYPKFDPLKIMAHGDTDPAPAPAGALYGAQVDTEISLQSEAFPVGAGHPAYTDGLDDRAIERRVRAESEALASPTMRLASLYLPAPLPPPDPKSPFAPKRPLGTARVTTENVSIAPMTEKAPDEAFGDTVIPVHAGRPIAKVLAATGYDARDVDDVSLALERLLGADRLEHGDVLRLGVDRGSGNARIMRASVYRNGKHAVTVARNDHGRFAVGTPPPMSDAVENAFDDTPVPTIVRRDLPSLYDGLYRAGLNEGMTQTMIGHIVKLLASAVDFKAAMTPNDTLEVFFSSPDAKGDATERSRLLFLDAHVAGKTIRLYRFHDSDDDAAYYDRDGKSIRPFLLRKPVPNGRFTSPFGMRHHPILGYDRMHWGCDWAAPRGTPILAVGDGTVEKAGWDSGGYGNQTIVNYGNGYESSYNHQSAIAKGVKAGAHVRQGQVIGYVGSTGLATGPHLHYEVIVNGTKVDPMKVRLPDRKPLKKDALVAFESERARIDSLLERADEPQDGRVAER
ncbi:M23 family metallopeptidase [Pararhizobium mangrovi]|uniref:M23 family metallopeptidase n=1 Tax=Pararhizobium mangrovi TaxID=2590452 RepID=A0A506U2Q0_9HYPH|nr:M23 family metallopeptidase [Pararhizobium mangrovi]TPW28642.1 M23 family metallopeptidase [Pararhizobium mangrovi]